MRRDGDLPYAWISDNTRWVRRLPSYPGPHAFVEEMLRGYRRALWADQPWNVEVWIEKEALAGTVVDVTAEWDVPLLVSRGFSSDTYLHEAAVSLADRFAEHGRRAAVYVLTDHDPSGFAIAETIERRLAELVQEFMPAPDTRDRWERWFDGSWLTVERLAVTTEQVTAWNLPTRPTKVEGNSHARDWRGKPSVELDAIPAPQLRALVSEAIERHLLPGALEEHRAQEERDREVLDVVRRAAAEARP
jgi:5S rRNA maturation endonuclease (ribonuclease M5)